MRLLVTKLGEGPRSSTPHPSLFPPHFRCQENIHFARLLYDTLDGETLTLRSARQSSILVVVQAKRPLESMRVFEFPMSDLKLYAVFHAETLAAPVVLTNECTEVSCLRVHIGKYLCHNTLTTFPISRNVQHRTPHTTQNSSSSVMSFVESCCVFALSLVFSFVLKTAPLSTGPFVRML